jgi:3-dehydroquinate dehydratase type I
MSKPRICVVITAKDPYVAVKAINRVLVQSPDFIEIRFDYMEKPAGFKKIREATVLPLIATNRLREQGGFWGKVESDRIDVLHSACDAGFNYVDLELGMNSINKTGEYIKSLGAKLIISHHDFDKTPRLQDLTSILRRELVAGADVCKIVGTANGYNDNLVYLRFLTENTGTELVSFGMGMSGIVSRILSPLFGGLYTYASASFGEESASGQPTISDLRSIYKIMGV